MESVMGGLSVNAGYTAAVAPADVLSVSDDEFEPAGALEDAVDEEPEDEEKRKRQLPRGNSAIFFRPLAEKRESEAENDQNNQNDQNDENDLDFTDDISGIQKVLSSESDAQRERPESQRDAAEPAERRKGMLSLRESLRTNRPPAASGIPPPVQEHQHQHRGDEALYEAQDAYLSEFREARGKGGQPTPLERKSMRDIALKHFGSSRKSSGMQQQHSAGSKNNIKSYQSTGAESILTSSSRGASAKLLTAVCSQTERSSAAGSKTLSVSKSSQNVSRQASSSPNKKLTPIVSRQASGASPTVAALKKLDSSSREFANGSGPADSYDGYVQNAKPKKNIPGWMKKLTNKNG